MIMETAVAIKSPTIKLNKAILRKLIEAYKAKRMQKWTNLPGGYTVWKIPAPRGLGTYFALITFERSAIGYVLVNKMLLQSKPKVRGWMIVQSYLLPDVRGVGIMNRVYNLILTTGRLIASPVMTQAAMRFWVNRIQTDVHHFYAVYDTQNSFVHVDPRSMGLMKNSIWDGSAKTILLCMNKDDPAIRKLNLLDR